MRITPFLVIVFFFCGLEAKAQFTKEVPLKPIYKQGWKYFYGGKKMNSVYALQIPLEALDNKEINERFKKFKKYQVFAALVHIPALAYLFTNIRMLGGHSGFRSRKEDVRTYLLLAAGGLGGSITFSALAHQQMNKAIDIYNIQIANKSSLGLNIHSLPKQNILGLSYHFTF